MRQRTYILLAGSVVLIVLAGLLGIPFIFQLTGTISNIAGGKTSQDRRPGIKPSIPVFEQTLEATSSANVVIAGVADPKTQIELYQNGESNSLETTDDAGRFTFKVGLKKGENTFTAQAISESGEKSDISNRYVILLLTGSPKLEISSPSDGFETKEKELLIKGKVDPGVTVTINDRVAIVDDEGNFSGYYSLSEGDNKIKVVGTDLAGNSTMSEITVKFSPKG